MYIPKIDRKDTGHSQASCSQSDARGQERLRARDRSFGLTEDSDLARDKRIKSGQAPAQLRSSHLKQQSSRAAQQDGGRTPTRSDTDTDESTEMSERENAARHSTLARSSSYMRQQQPVKPDPMDVDRFEALLSGGEEDRDQTCNRPSAIDEFMCAGDMGVSASALPPAWAIPPSRSHTLAPSEVKSIVSPSAGSRVESSLAERTPVAKESETAEGQAGAQECKPLSVAAEQIHPILENNAPGEQGPGLSVPGSGNSAYRDAECQHSTSAQTQMKKSESASLLLQEGSQFELVVQTRDLGPLHLSATQHQGGWCVRLRADSIEKQALLYRVSQAISRGLSRDLGVPVDVEIAG